MGFSENNIVNSKDWDNSKWKAFFKERLSLMRTKRKEYDKNWQSYEKLVESKSFYDNNGELQVNIPLEKTLKEIYMGRTDGKMNFDVLPDEQTDIEQLQPTKYAMLHFLDGNHKDTFWKENRYMRDIKSTYGSGIFFTGIRSYKDYRYVQKEDSEIESNTNLLNEKNFDKIENETWFFFPKALHPKDFYFDDAAYGQPDIQGGEDCIMKEKISPSEFEIRYGNNPNINKEEYNKVGYYTDVNEKNKESESIKQEQIIIFHYFYRPTKKYLIIANEEQLLYNGLYIYDDGKLPFVNIQHYTNVNRFRGEGIPERVGYLKAYKSEIWQDILAGAEMSSSVNFITGNDDQIGQDWTVGGRGVNIWRTNGGAERVQSVSASPNLGYFTSVLSLIDQQITVDTGINALEQFDPGTDKVGIKEIMEASKAVRNKSVDENYNIGLDEALTMMLARIKQFALALLAETIKTNSGKVEKIVYPKIKIKDTIVKKEKGKQIFEENLGKYGYFELKPDVVQGVGVKIVTPSTYSTLPILERQRVNEYINQMLTLSQAASLDQTGEAMNSLVKNMRFDELLKWVGDAYEYDINGLKANTEKDKIAQENLEKLEKIKQLISINQQTNAGPNLQNVMSGQNTQGNEITNGGTGNEVQQGMGGETGFELTT